MAPEKRCANRERGRSATDGSRKCLPWGRVDIFFNKARARVGQQKIEENTLNVVDIVYDIRVLSGIDGGDVAIYMLNLSRFETCSKMLLQLHGGPVQARPPMSLVREHRQSRSAYWHRSASKVWQF